MPPRSRARTAASTHSAISAVLQDSTDLLAEILNQVAAQQGLRTLAWTAPVCKIWLRVALPLAPTWDALLPLDTLDLNVTPANGVGGAPVAAAALHRDKSHKVSFVAALPPQTVAQGVPLLAASVGKDILMLSQQTGTPHAEVETGAGVWPTGLACDGQHLFVAGMLKCTIYKLTLSGGDIVEAQGGFGDCGSTAEARESAGSVLHSPQGLALHGSTAGPKRRPPRLRTAPRLPPWTVGRLRPLLHHPERSSLGSLRASTVASAARLRLPQR